LIGTALAQAPAAVGPSYTEGQIATTPTGGPSYANNNNNYQAPALPGPVANPTPGTIVIHVNGKVQVDFQGVWTSVDNRFFTPPAAGSLGAVLGNNGTGPAKLQPQSIQSFARVYFGGDAMATNGLRYGAAIEFRQNFTGQPSSNTSSGASGYDSLNTVFVRRAFAYVAGEQWGIVRMGVADGVIGIFDNGVTTFQFLPTGNLNGGDLQNMPQNVTPPFWFLGQAGNEYDNSKIVYLSPQIAGFDFGIQYAPNTSNGFGISSNAGGLGSSITGSGTGTGLNCATATSGCPSLSSGPGIQDGSRALNQTAVGLRYQGVFGGVGVLAYGVYEASGHADYTGLQTVAVLGTPAGGRFNGKYQGLSFGSGGVAVTFAGFTVGGNVIGGKINGQLGLVPKGGSSEFAYLIGAKYVAGPFTIGIVGEEGSYQGNPVMAGLTQRRGRGLSAGLAYTVAPGYTVYGEYLYNDIYQGGVNMITGATGSNANNNIKGQGFLVGNVVNF
jgi:hypothetical protein